jgi:hypothetical protein
MNDKFNTVENLVKNFLSADSDLAGIVNTFEQKLRADVNTYMQHELPAIAVHSTGYGIDVTQSDSRKLAYIDTTIEIVHRGGDLASVDDTVKQITSLVIDKLRLESPLNDGGGFGQAVDDIRIDRADIIPSQINNAFTVIGNVDAQIGIIER